MSSKHSNGRIGIKLELKERKNNPPCDIECCPETVSKARYFSYTYYEL